MKGYVYVIGWSRFGPVKIGRSTSPKARLASLQSAIPQTLRIYGAVRLDCCAVMEARCHALLAKSRIRGEWFDATPARAVALLKAEASRIDEGWTEWKAAIPATNGRRSRAAEAVSELAWQRKEYFNRE